MKSFLLVFGLLLAFSGRASATIIGGSVTGGTAFTAGGTFVHLVPPLLSFPLFFVHQEIGVMPLLLAYADC
jgi:hypothetical protein